MKLVEMPGLILPKVKYHDPLIATLDSLYRRINLPWLVQTYLQTAGNSDPNNIPSILKLAT